MIKCFLSEWQMWWKTAKCVPYKQKAIFTYFTPTPFWGEILYCKCQVFRNILFSNPRKGYDRLIFLWMSVKGVRGSACPIQSASVLGWDRECPEVGCFQTARNFLLIRIILFCLNVPLTMSLRSIYVILV